MQGKRVQHLLRITIAIVALLLVTSIGPLLLSAKQPAQARAFVNSTAVVASPPVQASATPPTQDNNTPAVIGAQGAVIAAVLAALIAGLFAILVPKMQYRREEILRQQEKAERQRKEEEEVKNALKLEEDFNLSKQQEEEKRLQNYRDRLRHDPHISKLQIFGMGHTLSTEDAYIQLRIVPDSIQSYKIPLVDDDDDNPGSEEFLRIERRYIEDRVGNALHPDEALRRYKRCVVVGAPGAGKTTLLKYLTLKAASNQLAGLPSFPIYCELGNFSSAKYTDMLDFVATYWASYHNLSKEDARVYIHGQAEGGNILLVLDGLDETRIGATSEEAENAYSFAIGAIKTWTATYPACPIIVTVREAAYRYRPQLPGFNELEVVEFNPEDIWRFVKNWFGVDKTMRREDKVTDLKIRLERSPRIMELASNPLLLSLIVMVYERHLDLPESRARLYEKCVNILLREWDASHGRLRYREFGIRDKWQLLEDVAWYFHNSRKHYFPDEELLEVIAKFLPAVSLPTSDNQKILTEIAIENGLLREQKVGYYSFSHLTFQEYFAARYIIEHKDLTTLQTHLGDTWWEEVLSLYAGDIPDASPLLNVLLGQEEDLFCTNLLLAGHCLSAKPIVRQVALREQVIDRLFGTLLATRYILLRESITKVLATIGGKETVFGREIFSRLQRLAEDDTVDLEIRKQIVYALGKFGGISLIQELGAMLLNKNSNTYLRASAARALEKFGGCDIREAMLELLEDEQEDWRVRQSIAIALGTCSDKCAVANLLALLQDKRRNTTVQAACAFALGILGDNRVVEALLELLSDDEIEMYVRGSIAVALGKLGDARAVPTLLDLLADKHLDQFIGQRIALTLGSLELDANAVSTLLTLVADEEIDVHVRMSIATMPGKYYDKSALQLLREMLLNPGVNAFVRASIATALGTLGDQIVIPDMQDMLLDQTLDVNVRGSIIAALRLLGIKEVTSELITLLSNQHLNQNVLLDISKSLSNFGNYSNAERQKIAQELVVLLPQDDINRAVRQNVAIALGHLGSKEIVHRLLALLGDQNVDRDVRQSIAYVIPQMTQEEQYVQELVSLLASTDIPNDIYVALWAVNRRKRRGAIVVK